MSCAKSNEIKSLAEIAKNLLAGNIPMTTSQRNRLRPYKKSIKFLALKKNAISRKRRALQRGGAFFIPLLTSLASGLLGSLLKN